MKLSNTVTMMNSTDYKERFRAEYFQLKIRITGLQNMLKKWDNHTLNFTPTCNREIYNVQLKAMQDYMKILEERASIENVDLSYDDSEEISILAGDVEGHTKYLQGIDMPIMVNSIRNNNDYSPSDVSEMHISIINGKSVVLITPKIIAL